MGHEPEEIAAKLGRVPSTGSGNHRRGGTQTDHAQTF